MTSGEWDLCALKALEEEEQAQFLSISDSNLLDIPPPPPLHKKVLPTIKEHCGDTTLATEEPSTCNTLPKTILSSLSSSSASEASSSTPTFFKRNKKLFKKNSSSHPYKGLFKTNSTIQIGGSGNSINNYSSDFDIDCDSNTFVPSPKSLDSKEMMTMMMFLSSSSSGAGVAATPEVNSPSNAAGTGIFIEDELSKSFFATTSPPSDRNHLFTSSEDDGKGGGGSGGVVGVVGPDAINKSDNRKRVHVNLCKKERGHDECSKKCNGGNKSLLPTTIQVQSQSPLIDGLGNTVKLTTSTLGISSQTHKCSGTTVNGDSNENIVDELEEHIKHCSCSCNHMGYGNSMDYQTTGFGGLPDVTEHSNIRRTTLSRQNSLSMSSELTDISTLQKSKKSIKSSNRNSSSSTVSCRSINQKPNRRFCIFSFTLLAAAILIIVASMAIYHFVFLTPSRNSHEERLKIVRKILKEVPLVDGHNDFPYNVRTYAHGSLELLELNHNVDHKNIWDRPKWSQTDIKRLKEGLVGAQIWSAYVPCEAQGLDAVQLALEQIDIIHRYADLNSKDTMLATTSKDILLAHKSGLLASLVGVVGGHSLGSSLGVLRSFHALGARYLTLTHECDVSWAGSSATANEKGLTVFGKAVIKEMNRLGMLIDLSYSSDSTAKDVLEFTRAPIIYSHSAARSLCNSSRNIPDDIIRSVTDNGGLIMISFDSEYVSCSEHDSNMHDVIAHIKYIRSITGVQHIGIGAGFDGIKKTPSGLEDVSKYPNLLAALLKDPNWSEEDIAMLSGKNFLRVLQSVENVRDYYKKMSLEPLENSEPIKKTQCSYMSS